MSVGTTVIDLDPIPLAHVVRPFKTGESESIIGGVFLGRLVLIVEDV